jgi:AdoMet-dependent rRNA methyltransferase SPB1
MLLFAYSNVSAEIFVVCRDFHAPKHVDPKFLDPKHVFQDLSASASADKGSNSNNTQLNVFQPEKKRRKRDGYEEGNYILHKNTGVAEFIRSPDPIAILGTVNQMKFETEEEKGCVTYSVDIRSHLTQCEVGQPCASQLRASRRTSMI